MRFKDVKVGGITTVVIKGRERTTEWRKTESGLWRRPEDGTGKRVYNSHAEMMAIVNLLKRDRRYEMGIDASCGTLHIVRKNTEQTVSIVMVATMPDGTKYTEVFKGVPR